MEKPTRKLLQKYMRNACSPKEVEEVIAFFRKKEHLRDFPEMEEVLDATDRQASLGPDASERIFENIHSQAQCRTKVSGIGFIKSRVFWSGGIAALFAGLLTLSICSDYFPGAPADLPVREQDGFFVFDVDAEPVLSVGPGTVVWIEKDFFCPSSQQGYFTDGDVFDATSYSNVHPIRKKID